MLFLHLKSQQQFGKMRMYFYGTATKAAFTLFLVSPCLFPPSFFQAAITMFQNERKIHLSAVTKGAKFVIHYAHFSQCSIFC